MYMYRYGGELWDRSECITVHVHVTYDLLSTMHNYDCTVFRTGVDMDNFSLDTFFICTLLHLLCQKVTHCQVYLPICAALCSSRNVYISLALLSLISFLLKAYTAVETFYTFISMHSRSSSFHFNNLLHDLDSEANKQHHFHCSAC